MKTYLENVKKKSPLIHNITNYVTVNDCANIILACGASPIMADDKNEAPEITTICGGLNINVGTLNSRTIEATIVMSVVIFTKGGASGTLGEAMSFGAAVELSVAMPLSWLPLISDYTKDAEKPVKASAVSAVVYGLISSIAQLRERVEELKKQLESNEEFQAEMNQINCWLADEEVSFAEYDDDIVRYLVESIYVSEDLKLTINIKGGGTVVEEIYSKEE